MNGYNHTDELQAALQSAMLGSERFLEALMQEAPLGAPVHQPVYDYHTVPTRKDNDRE